MPKRKGIEKTMILKVENLCKRDILHNISFEIEEGEMVSIMGPSGSGKSTLLYNISGMDSPDSGTVLLGGQELTSMAEDEKAKVRLKEMGFVFQQMNVMENLNVLDNILLPRVEANRKLGKQKRDKASLVDEAKEIMRKLSIEDLGDRRTNEVSGGQLQRACIARSVINDPQIIFADEPTGALNRKASDEVMDTLEALNKAGKTICMVTHDSRMASRCHRILYLVDGQIQGEFVQSKETSPKERETQVNQWLSQMEW